jgi:hypothetical protein
MIIKKGNIENGMLHWMYSINELKISFVWNDFQSLITLVHSRFSV